MDDVLVEAEAPFWQGADTADMLSYAAAVYGVPEETLVQGLLQHSGDDGGGFSAHLDGRRRQEEAALEQQMAEQFEQLSATVPEIRRVEDLPDGVLEQAVQEGIPLLDAYLRQWYATARQAAAQEEAGRQAAAQSAGSLGGVFEEIDPKETAFSRAFRKQL